MFLAADVGCSKTESSRVADERPNFSGRWNFSADDSALQIAQPDDVEVVIEHKDSSFRLARTLTFGDRRDEFELALTIGDEAKQLARGNAVLYPAIQWDGEQLEFLTKIVKEDDESTNKVRYHLEKDGTVMIADEQYRGPELSYDNRWVFTKIEN